MKSLLKYSITSSLMLVKINHNGEEVKFRLNEEASIDERRINKTLINQPKVYGFLTMLHKQLIKKAKDAERRKKRQYDLAFIRHKDSGSNEYAKAKAGSDMRYQTICKELIQIEGDRDTIEACVKTMEMRSQLLQTLSANQRKESF